MCAVRAIRRFTVRTVLPENLAALEDLAINLRWSWHPETRDLFAAIDPALWDEGGHDPVRLLGEVSAERLAELAADEGFVDWANRSRRRPARLPRVRPLVPVARRPTAPAGIAYFSPEFGIAAALPQYSGGLGILAGDHLKTASDLGVPIIGVGLFYRHGYFRQSLSRDGWQQERYPVLDPDGLPFACCASPTAPRPRSPSACPAAASLPPASGSRRSAGSRCCCSTPTSRRTTPSEREVTDRLYGGGSEHRLQQEMLLGIGGVRALRAYCRITGRPGARGVPHERGPRRLPRPRAHPRARRRESGA